MNCSDVADILCGLGLSVQETPVTTEALSLPGGVRVRKLTEVGNRPDFALFVEEPTKNAALLGVGARKGGSA
jgi:hypothetical protein